MKLFDLGNEYRQGAGGYISRADHTSGLSTPQEVYDGLRLDYQEHLPLEERAFRPDNENPVYAVRFQTADTDNLLVPDQRLLDELSSRGIGVKGPGGEPYTAGHPDLDQSPNTGHGFTGSTVDHARIIPEYEVAGGAEFKHGAEMWEINKSGPEVFVGIFDLNLGEAGEWRRVLSSIG